MDFSALPVFLMLLCAVGLALGLLAVAHVFTRGRAGAVQQMPYESGMDPIHDTRRRFDVRFHLLAIAFLIFDVELLFLFPWAVAWGGGRGEQGIAVAARTAKAASQRAEGRGQKSDVTPPSSFIPRPSSARHVMFAGAMTFLVLLAVGYVYDWRQGVFQWR